MLTARQKEILALAIELCDRRQVAIVLNMGFVTLDNHLARIVERMNLPTRYIPFKRVPLDGKFVYQGTTYQRVDRSTDRFGGYNAQDMDGNRALILYHIIVEQLDHE